MTMIDGTKVTLEELRGQVVVINFWASWCGRCKRERPLLDAYYESQRQHGLRVFAITTEGSVPASQLKKLFAALCLTPVRSLKGNYAPINNSIPTNSIIDRGGPLALCAGRGLRTGRSEPRTRAPVKRARARRYDADDVERALRTGGCAEGEGEAETPKTAYLAQASKSAHSGCRLNAAAT